MPEYDVVLLDPGPRHPGLTALLCEVTGRSTGDCAELLTAAPVPIATVPTRRAADDLAARLREFDALAVARPAGAARDTPRPVTGVSRNARRSRLPAATAAAGVAMLGVALWWFHQGLAPAALFGVLLGVVAIAYGLLIARAR
jgi:hypothetical protein